MSTTPNSNEESNTVNSAYDYVLTDAETSTESGLTAAMQAAARMGEYDPVDEWNDQIEEFEGGNA